LVFTIFLGLFTFGKAIYTLQVVISILFHFFSWPTRWWTLDLNILKFQLINNKEHQKHGLFPYIFRLNYFQH
jgi:hypothetical protein